MPTDSELSPTMIACRDYMQEHGGKIRSTFYPGMADACAKQWGSVGNER